MYFYLLSGCRWQNPVVNYLIWFLKDYEISAPLERSLYWDSDVMQAKCAVYEPSPRLSNPPLQAAPQVIQRGTWKASSTSSSSSKFPFTYLCSNQEITPSEHPVLRPVTLLLLTLLEANSSHLLYSFRLFPKELFRLFAVHMFCFVRAITGPFSR